MTMIDELRCEIRALEDRIEEIQKACPHPAPALTKDEVKMPITEYYEDEINGGQQRGWRDGYNCVCGLCGTTWMEYEDGRKYSMFDSEHIGRI